MVIHDRMWEVLWPLPQNKKTVLAKRERDHSCRLGIVLVVAMQMTLVR